MSVKIQFSQNNHVALYKWTDPVTLVDFEYAFNTIGAAYEEASGPIHSIFTTANAGSLPMHAITTFLNHPNSRFQSGDSGLLIFVTSSEFASTNRELTNLLEVSDKVMICETVEEAFEKLENVLQLA